MANSSIKNLNIDGNVVISGSTTSIDVATVTVDDKHIELNAIPSPSDANANHGGIIIKSADGDKVFSWVRTEVSTDVFEDSWMKYMPEATLPAGSHAAE